MLIPSSHRLGIQGLGSEYLFNTTRFSLDESMSLKNFGLSDICLATLASQANQKVDHSDLSFRENMYNGDKANNIKVTNKPATDSIEVTKEGEKDPNQVEVKRPILQVSKDGYKSLPSYIASLASWESCALMVEPHWREGANNIKYSECKILGGFQDLLAAVEKINSSLNKKEKTKGYNYFYQDEIEALGLGPKGRAYLLLLVRMSHLIVETTDGWISY
ncbi:hypothetical protein GOBAR_AA09783 [Gossypium barbadense]|uniref:Uncharacterized protein n=1 Tax=Gossypium barbadense TaxID=3634 RepID=A0A2P5Y5I8_GOSBA|nr:hypothetical protein GOBAR_AA09783 [Gossypium barbadense]